MALRKERDDSRQRARRAPTPPWMTRRIGFGAYGLLWILVSGAVAARAAETIQLSVERGRITAGDLARVAAAWNTVDPSVIVAHAPQPGIQRKVTPGQMSSWAKRFGVELDPKSLPATVLVSRRMRRLEAHEAVERLTAGIAEHYQLDRGQVRVSLDRYFEPLVPATKLNFRLVSGLRAFDKTVPVPLRWQDADGLRGTVLLRAAVSILGISATAKDSIPAGTELSPQDFVFQQGPLPGPPDRFLLRPGDIEGKELKLQLKPGDTLETRMLMDSETVRRGDLIQLELRSGGVLLRAPGRAEQSGSMGDPITCRNLESGRRVRAKIVDSKSAEVIWEP